MDENKTHPYAAYKRLTQIVGRKPKVTGWKRQSLQMKTKKAGVAILISDMMGFKSETVTTDKEKHYI